MGHRLHRPQSSQARTQADSVRGVAVGRCRGLNKAGGVTNQVTPHPIHHRAWPMSIRHDNLDRLLGEEINLNASTRDVDELLASLDPAAWHPDARREVLVNYLGFPFWDEIGRA